MAEPQVRAYRLRESLLHCGVAVVAVVIVYLLGTFLGDGAVAATRYFSG